MKNKLITSLRVAANALERGSFPYAWDEPSQCNCGVLACAILGLSPTELDSVLPEIPHEESQTWTKRAGYYCPVTGMPTQQIFKALHDAGMKLEDYRELEYLDNPEALARCDFGTITKGKLWWKKTLRQREQYDKRMHVVIYMRAWADLLTEEGRDDAPARQPATAAA